MNYEEIIAVLVTELYVFSVFGNLNSDYDCIVNSREMILVPLLDNIVGDKIKVIPGFYHHYFSCNHVYNSAPFSPRGASYLGNYGNSVLQKHLFLVILTHPTTRYK